MLTPISLRPLSATRPARGLSLIIVLLALVTMGFAATALVRSIDTGSLILGNLGFKKSALNSSDQPADTAIAWLQANLSGNTLFSNSTSNAYYATSLNSLDVTGNGNDSSRPKIDWLDDDCGGCESAGSCSSCITPKTAQTTADGHSHRYLITRMCKTAEDPNASTNTCVFPTSTSSGTSPKKGELKYGENVRFTGETTPYYRIIVRTTGARNTASITETYVHF